MGAKNLKAVAVDGDLAVPVADPARFDRARADVLRLFRASPALFGELGFGEYGTAALVDLTRHRRMTPTENFRLTVFDGSAAYSGPAIRKAFHPKRDACADCPVGCGKIGPAGNPLPEYEAASHFGALNGIRNLDAIVLANDICNEAGMDPVSAAATLSAWGEARGRFPSSGELLRLLEDIALRRGEGLLLADGSRRAAEALGRPELSMSVKSLELPAYDPRGAYGTALAYCTSNHGGCHLPAYPISHEILRKPAGLGPVLLLREGADDPERRGRLRGRRLPGGVPVRLPRRLARGVRGAAVGGDRRAAQRGGARGDRGTDPPDGAVLQRGERLHEEGRRPAGALLPTRAAPPARGSRSPRSTGRASTRS